MSVIFIRVEGLLAQVPRRDNSADSANPYVRRCKNCQISKLQLLYYPWILRFLLFPKIGFILNNVQLDRSVRSDQSEIPLNDLPAQVPKFGNFFKQGLQGINLTIQNVCTKTHTCRFVGDATIFLIVALHLGCC